MLRQLFTGLLLFGVSNHCFGSSVEAWFCNISWDYAVYNLDTQDVRTGDMRQKSNYEDPWGNWLDGKWSKSITLDSSGTPFFIKAETDTICRLNTATETYIPIIDIPGVKEIEISGNDIYAMTDTSLYKYSSGTVSKLCDISGFGRFAVSPTGRMVGVKYPIYSGDTNPTPNDWGSSDAPDEWDWTVPNSGSSTSTETIYGLYDIDPLTGDSTSIVNNPYFYGTGRTTDEGYINGELIGLERIGISDICFDTEGSFWMMSPLSVYQVELDSVQTTLNYKPRSYGYGGFVQTEPHNFLTATEYGDTPGNLGLSSVQSFDILVTPEPMSMLLLMAGGLVLVHRRNN